MTREQTTALLEATTFLLALTNEKNGRNRGRILYMKSIGQTAQMHADRLRAAFDAPSLGLPPAPQLQMSEQHQEEPSAYLFEIATRRTYIDGVPQPAFWKWKSAIKLPKAKHIRNIIPLYPRGSAS